MANVSFLQSKMWKVRPEAVVAYVSMPRLCVENGTSEETSPRTLKRGKQCHLKLLLLLTIIILSYAPLFTLLVIITLSLFFFTARLRRRRRVLLCSKEREREESFLKTALKKTTV